MKVMSKKQRQYLLSDRNPIYKKEVREKCTRNFRLALAKHNFGFKKGHKLSTGIKRPYLSLRNKDPEFIKSRTEKLKGSKRPDLALLHKDPEYKKRVKGIFSRLNKDPEFIKKRMKAITKKPNKKETILINLFKQNELPYKYVGDGELIIGNKCPDFVNCNGQKKIIELFGDVFHNPKKSFFDIDWKRTDVGTKAIYSQYGFKTLIIWENELKDLDKVLEQIKRFDGGI